MRKPISPRLHGTLDYATAAATATIPRLLGFPPAARQACDTLAAGYTGLSAITDYPLSVTRVVPFKGHGAAEVLLGAALPAVPWLLGFSRHRPARNFFFALTAVTAFVALLTDWDARG